MQKQAANSVNALARHGPAYLNPLPVVAAEAQGCWLTDVDGRRHLDLVSGFSALNHGHRHPRLVGALIEQLGKLGVASRMVYSREMAAVVNELCGLTGLDRVILMNSGAEAVETALKVVRRWGYERKGVAPERAEIIACQNSFHGRTLGALSATDSAGIRAGFAPLLPGFQFVPFGDAGALAEAIGPDTVAFLVEPIQVEGGVVVPPAGYLAAAREICDRAGIALVADEVHVGLGRTGELFACASEGVQPDLVLLGKSLGGGLLPVSAVAGKDALMSVLGPGTHGSTLGGNPLACAVAHAALRVTVEEDLPARSRESGRYLAQRLRQLESPWVREIRGRGLLLGIALSDEAPSAREVCLKLLEHGLLCSEARQKVVRILPPLIIERGEIDWALERLERVFHRSAPVHPAVS